MNAGGTILFGFVHEWQGSDGPQYGNVADLEAAKAAFRTAWEKWLSKQIGAPAGAHPLSAIGPER